MNTVANTSVKDKVRALYAIASDKDNKGYGSAFYTKLNKLIEKQMPDIYNCALQLSETSSVFTEKGAARTMHYVNVDFSAATFTDNQDAKVATYNKEGGFGDPIIGRKPSKSQFLFEIIWSIARVMDSAPTNEQNVA